MNYDLSQVKDLEKMAAWVKRLEPELLNNFIRYWTIRKSSPPVASSLIREIKNIGSHEWINLIESNHKFRTLYGEDTAKKIIEVIEESCS